ncbi:hypothetical protein MLD38_014899 [Melastoma candidum]|uniref:Uncharacterized protein n=1 Tax=Melastoma candidum TaxID=119954 RepID=A0ACB9RED6_9MYRT|nr:hypothetical protein MLD38_014899 [Melastoma candidum]
MGLTATGLKKDQIFSGKFDVHYLHPSAAVDASIGLHPVFLLDLSAAIGSKDVTFGGEIGVDTASAFLAKYNAGVLFNGPDFSAAVVLLTRARLLKPGACTPVRVAMLCQRECRPKSLITFALRLMLDLKP